MAQPTKIEVQSPYLTQTAPIIAQPIIAQPVIVKPATTYTQQTHHRDHDDDGHSLYNMYGFKQNEGNIQDVFKFIAASKNMNISENQFEHAQMQNGNVWVLTKRSHLIWKATLDSMAEGSSSRVTEVDDDILKRKPIKKMFVDPRGLHCFLLAEHEIFYNHWSSNRVFQLATSYSEGGMMNSQPKAFKSIDLQYVAPRDYETFEILLGTQDGQIFHSCLQFSQKGLDVIDPLKSVFDIQEFGKPILDLKIAKIAGNQIVLAITDSSLHQFHSNKNVNLKSTFSDYYQNRQLLKEHTITLDASGGSHNQRDVSVAATPHGSLAMTSEDLKQRVREEASSNDDITYNQLRLFCVTNNNLAMDEESIIGGFGWMNEYGFYYASYDPDEYIIKKKRLETANYVKKEGDTLQENVLPNAFAITQFHIVYMYARNITVLSKISREIVFSSRFDEQDQLLGIILDQRKNRLMIFGKVPPLQVAYLRGEDQDAWRYYLRREQFGQALQACKTAKQRAFAAGYYADHLFSREKFDMAADYYAQSDKTFEEVSLKFLHAQRYTDLVSYLERILRAIDPRREDLQPQRMLLYTWIVELKLNQINSLQAQASLAMPNSSEAKSFDEEIALRQRKFHEFLKEHAGSLGAQGHETVFQLLQSHGKINECIKFAEDVGAHEAVIVHYINKQEFQKALKKVESIPDKKSKNQVMLRYASVFIKNLPELTIDALSKFDDIDVAKLVPAFMNIPRTPANVMDKAKNFVIDYCINKRKSTDKTVHNLALYFYAERDKPDELLSYLRQQESAKEGGRAIFFEVDYALNVCKQKEKELSQQIDDKRRKGQYSTQTSQQQQSAREINEMEQMLPKLKRAQIILYAILGLFDKAVKLSLECRDIDMAKSYAEKPHDKKLKKKLWMKIAKYLFNYQSKKQQLAAANNPASKYLSKPIGTAVTGQVRPQEVDVTKALEILHGSVLKIDDLLPLFPEDAKVEDMKKHLCECLDQYNSKILDLKQQLSEHSKSAEELRKKQRKQRHKHITINPAQECDLCATSIFKKEFYVFPCLHAFHRECVYRQLKNYSTKDPRIEKLVQKVCGLFSKIENIKAKAAFVHSEMNPSSQGGTSMMFSSKGASQQMGGFDDGNKNSLISDIKNYFTKSVRAGMIPSGGPGGSNQASQILQQRDQEDIRQTLNQIDDILTRECFYCGSLLLDMIDNDVFSASAQSKDYEFYSVSQEEANQITSFGEEEWRIK